MNKKFTTYLLITLVFITAPFYSSSMNAPGTLDPSFGGTPAPGLVVTDFDGGTDIAIALVRQPDLKLVAAGQAIVAGNTDFGLTRYLPDGQLDVSFGNEGKVTTNFSGGSDIARALILQPDGKLVAAGSSSSNFGLARYLPDGTLDPDFGGGALGPIPGTVITDFNGGNDIAFALILQPDGKLVAAGQVGVGFGVNFGLARYLPNGMLDPDFGDGGKVITPTFGVGNNIANALILQPDGKLVVAGVVGVFGTNFGLARYLSDGTLDPDFGNDGTLTTDFQGGDDAANGLLLQPNGRLVAVGTAQIAGIFNFALARYLPNGILDPSFGNQGKVTTNFSGLPSQANHIILQPGATEVKLVVAGQAGSGVNTNFALARYFLNGTLDPDFGTEGKVTTDFAGSIDQANALVLQPSGTKLKLVAAGRAGTDFGLAQYFAVNNVSRLAAAVIAKYCE